MKVENVLKSNSLFELIDSLNGFCKEVCLRKNDDECFELKEKVLGAYDNGILTLLASYLITAEDGDEIVEGLYEFISNCKGFVEADKEVTKEITKEEFEAVLDECEEKCRLKSCIESEHRLNVVSVDAYNQYREFAVKMKGDNINLILSRIDINLHTKQYIAEELGIILYDVLATKLNPELIKQEMCRYIPDVRKSDLHVKQLFKKYLYDVVSYKERKPDIYKEFDEHMKSVIVLEFFKRIIEQYLKE